MARQEFITHNVFVIKESDRIAAMEEELNKCGVSITTSEGEIIIHGANHYRLMKA